MNANLIGGESEGKRVEVADSVDLIELPCLDGTKEFYKRALGTTFGMGEQGQRVDEEAAFVSTSLLERGAHFVIDYMDQRGL